MHDLFQKLKRVEEFGNLYLFIKDGEYPFGKGTEMRFLLRRPVKPQTDYRKHTRFVVRVVCHEMIEINQGTTTSYESALRWVSPTQVQLSKYRQEGDRNKVTTIYGQFALNLPHSVPSSQVFESFNKRIVATIWAIQVYEPYLDVATYVVIKVL